MSAVLIVTSVTPVLADREDDVRAARDANKNALSQTESNISNAEAAKEQVNNEIADLDNQLVTLLASMEVLKGDIATTEEQIVQTTSDLADAEETRDNQYAAMMDRIQYIYENSSDGTWLNYLFKAEDLEDFLNRTDYTQQITKYDRTLLTNYMTTVQEVKDLKTALETKEAELEEEKGALEEQEASLEAMLEEKRTASANYENEIANLQAQAQALTEEIYRQNAEIARIQEEKAEAARRAAEEEARRRAAEEAARQEAERQAAAAQEEAARQASLAQAAQAAANQGNEAAAQPAPEPAPQPVITAPASSVGGAAANFALQFLGNPYVWGGTSLTNGCDCSGFVMAVYANFGIGLPHSSDAMAGCGVPVSFSEIQPGDIICYGGHVAIYIGNNTIVHASNSQTGIITTTPANYRPIIAVRRLG